MPSTPVDAGAASEEDPFTFSTDGAPEFSEEPPKVPPPEPDEKPKPAKAPVVATTEDMDMDMDMDGLGQVLGSENT